MFMIEFAWNGYWSHVSFGGEMIQSSVVHDGIRQCPHCKGANVHIVQKQYRFCDDCRILLEEMEGGSETKDRVSTDIPSALQTEFKFFE